MRISQNNILIYNFKSNNTYKDKEFIDKLMENVKNPKDINDTVTVPRGIFKAYLYLMGGTSLMSLASFLPHKLNKIKPFLNISGVLLNFMSAIYFAKPFIIKDVKKQ